MTGFLITVAVVLALIGSVMWVQPSRRDKTLAQMRMKALSYGIKVRILDEKLANKLFPWLKDYRLYSLYEKPSQQKLIADESADFVVRLKPSQSLHELDYLDPAFKLLSEAGLLSQLPDGVEALWVTKNCLSILVKEETQQGVTQVDAINKYAVECLSQAQVFSAISLTKAGGGNV